MFDAEDTLQTLSTAQGCLDCGDTPQTLFHCMGLPGLQGHPVDPTLLYGSSYRAHTEEAMFSTRKVPVHIALN